jgi:hypothetical protein
VCEVVQVRLDVWQMMLNFFRQVLGVTNPATGFAGAGRLVVSQTPVKRLNQLDAFTQRLAEFFGGLVVAVHEVFKAVIPVAITATVTVMTAFAGGFVEILVGVVAAFDELPDQQSGISERFY